MTKCKPLSEEQLAEIGAQRIGSLSQKVLERHVMDLLAEVRACREVMAQQPCNICLRQPTSAPDDIGCDGCGDKHSLLAAYIEGNV